MNLDLMHAATIMEGLVHCWVVIVVGLDKATAAAVVTVPFASSRPTPTLTLSV